VKFSVLLSVYTIESPKFLRESIDSIYAQTLLPDEVVLVEDGPLSDDLYAVIEDFKTKYDTLRVIPLKEKQGLGTALNVGLEACKYDIVARMDTDDISKPNRFEKQIAFKESHPEIDLCSAWVDEFEGDIDNVISQRKIPENHQDIYEYGKKKCPVNHPVTVYRKNSVLKAGGYGKYPEDYLLWVKMLTSGCKFYGFQESLLWYRLSKDFIKRRGGLTYAWHELQDQVKFYKMGYTNLFQFLFNAIIRFTVRLIPSPVRSLTYRYLLRKRYQKTSF
jgi:glycosyltransferase involved in cell wall biosynthesis